jgi:hypothetical protein
MVLSADPEFAAHVSRDVGLKIKEDGASMVGVG